MRTNSEKKLMTARDTLWDCCDFEFTFRHLVLRFFFLFLGC